MSANPFDPMVGHDPRDFIEPPYIQCPKCKKMTYGIWYVGVSDYLQLCKECPMPDKNKGEKPTMISLPALQKKLSILIKMLLAVLQRHLILLCSAQAWNLMFSDGGLSFFISWTVSDECN